MENKELDSLSEAIKAGKQEITLSLIPILPGEKIEKGELIFRTKTRDNYSNSYGFMVSLEEEEGDQDISWFKVFPLSGNLTVFPREEIARHATSLYRVKLSSPSIKTSSNKKEELDILF